MNDDGSTRPKLLIKYQAKLLLAYSNAIRSLSDKGARGRTQMNF
jgi:hypothetical protein